MYMFNKIFESAFHSKNLLDITISIYKRVNISILEMRIRLMMLYLCIARRNTLA